MLVICCWALVKSYLFLLLSIFWVCFFFPNSMTASLVRKNSSFSRDRLASWLCFLQSMLHFILRGGNHTKMQYYQFIPWLKTKQHLSITMDYNLNFLICPTKPFITWNLIPCRQLYLSHILCYTLNESLLMCPTFFFLTSTQFLLAGAVPSGYNAFPF